MPGVSEVAAGVFVLRQPVLDVNATLIVGGEVAAVVDTLSTDAQAHELLAAVRAVTSLPLVLVNTHNHFDHWYGNAVLADASPGATIWAHVAAATPLRDDPTRWQQEWVHEYAERDPELAAGIAAVAPRPPDRTVHIESTMDLGGRDIDLRHFGRGHTDGDLVVSVPDAAVVLAGDLIEQGAPPAFGDSYPVDWPETIAALLHAIAAESAAPGPSTVVIPGHGRPVDLDFVRAQHEELTALAWLIREGHADGAPMDRVVAKAPFPAEVARTAAMRGYAELDGRI